MQVYVTNAEFCFTSQCRVDLPTELTKNRMRIKPVGHGAALFLRYGADRLIHRSKAIFLHYVAANYESWCQFAGDKGIVQGDNNFLGPILVRGWIKTSTWNTFAWSHDGITVYNLEPSGENFTAGDGVHSQSSPSRSTKERDEPGTLDTRDQCVFLSYFSAKRRSELSPRIVDSPEPRGDESGRGPRTTKVRSFICAIHQTPFSDHCCSFMM